MYNHGDLLWNDRAQQMWIVMKQGTDHRLYCLTIACTTHPGCYCILRADMGKDWKIIGNVRESILRGMGET